MSYSGFVAMAKNVRPHPNADRLVLADFFGNTVCVSKDYDFNIPMVYFPSDGQLSEEFCKVNNLVRLYDENGHQMPGGGYMDPDKRNVTAIKLRGEKSDGLALPISCLDYCFSEAAAANLKEGDSITVVNGHDICQKYIPKRKNHHSSSVGNRTRKKKVPIAPLFAEHADTEQLAYNLDAFKSGDEIEITLKMHGTSQRTGYLPVLIGYNDSPFCDFINWFKSLLDPNHEPYHDGEPIYDWDYVSGTRRTVLESFDGGFYGSNAFREPHSKAFEGKLHKGEIVYYEVVGFVDNGTPIMATADNKKTGDKEFIKQYGKTTTFSYGCEPSQSDIYVYRMTMTNEDGFVVECTPDFMRYRCEQMGVKTVPVFYKGIIPDEEIFTGTSCSYTGPGEWVKEMAEKYFDGPDPIGKTHVREGVVVRILNRPNFCAYKSKNFSFKCLEGIAKTSAEAPDMEEAESLI